MKTIGERYGHTLHVTLNLETATSAVAIISLQFDRSSKEQVDRAHACSDALLRYLRSQGIELYRARVDQMSDVTNHDPEYWNMIRSLKSVFDPDNIIAPGRYNLP
jgi:4-cresol dehydrogenase (hydroxylating)